MITVQCSFSPSILDHESFGVPISKSFGRPGAEAICTDVAYNKYTNRIFIACFAKLSTQTVNSTLWVYEINGDTGATVGSYTTHLDDDVQKIVHRANIMLVPIRRGSQVELGVIVYDQGVSSGLVDHNKWAWVLSGADTDTLADLGVQNIQNLPMTSVYDMFPHWDYLLLTGKNSSIPTDIIKMASCQIILSGGKLSIDCNSTLIPAPFNTSIGYVGIMNTGQYVEVNANLNNTNSTNPDTISICNFQGRFGEQNFIDVKACAAMPSIQIPDGVSISVVEGNVHQVNVQYVHFDSTYAGFSNHNFDLRHEFSHIDDQYAHHLIPLGKSLIKVNKTELAIHRMVPPYFFVKADELKAGLNIIRIECKDIDTTSPVASYINVTMLESMNDNVYLNKDKIPDFSAYDGGRFMFQIDSDMMMGNDLQVQVSFDNSIKAYAKAQVYDTELININWKVTNTSVDFESIHFSGHHAITLDRRGWISFHFCFFREIASLQCVERASTNRDGHNMHLMKDINSVYGWLFAWAVDRDYNLTLVFIYDGTKIITHTRPGVADDCAMTEAGPFAYQACAYSEHGEIRGFQYPQMNPEFAQPMPTIYRRMSGYDYFCPVDIDFDPQIGYIMEVLSLCPGKDQRIIRYRYPPTENRDTGELQLRIVSSIPINFAFQNPQYCSMGTEFVVYSRVNGINGDLQSYNTVDDLNSWNFGTLMDDFNLGNMTDFNCIPRAGMFSTVSRDLTDPNKVSLAIYWGNNQWQANHKVYNIRRDNLAKYKFIDSYEFDGQVIHTLYNPMDHTHDFMLSFTKGPLVDVHLEHGVCANQSVVTSGMQINIKNTKQAFDTIHKRVEVVDAAAKVKVNIKKKLSVNPSGIFNLEEYIDIKGPVAEAYIRNSSHAVDLIGRLHLDAVYNPHERDHGIFSNLQVFGTKAVGVKTSQSNTSTFTIFHNINDYMGEYTPAHGVKAYHFAPLNSDPFSSILIAYSTAEPTHNSLQFVALKNADRMAIGQAGDRDILNFSMIRVIPLTSTDGDNFLVLGMNGDEHEIHHFIVTLKNGQITTKFMNIVPDVHDFGYAAPSDLSSIYVVYNQQDDFEHVAFEKFDKKTGAPQGTVKRRVNLGPIGLGDGFNLNYRINSLFAKEHNSTAFYVVFNTDSPYLIEYVYDEKYMDHPAIFRYNKMPGHDGRFMDGNMQNIAMMTFADIASGDSGIRYVFWTRQIQTNNGSIFPVWTMHSESPRPFAMTNCPHNMSHFHWASHWETSPLIFLYVAPMMLNISDNTKIEHAVLEIETAAHQTGYSIKIMDIIGGDEAKKSMAWWPFVLVIGVLILLAVGFIIYKAQKDKAMEVDDPENYISLKPEAKDAKTERQSE